MRKRVLILFLVVLLLIIGVFVYNKFKPIQKINSLKTSDQKLVPSPSPEPRFKSQQDLVNFVKDEKSLYDGEYFKAVDKLGKFSNTIVFNSCIPDPLVTKTNTKKNLTLVNQGSKNITVSIVNSKYQVPAGRQLVVPNKIGGSAFAINCFEADAKEQVVGIVNVLNLP